jgi:organic hydroperoxide reductase OsmC/OhrA
MTAPFPHRYEIRLDWPGHGGAALTAGSRPAITGGAPREFDGRDSWWSPEHLLLSSLSLCLMTTFEAVAAKTRLPVHGYRCRSEGILDRTEEGLGFTALRLRVELEVDAEDVERARTVMTKAKKHCLVAAALEPVVDIEVSVLTRVMAGVC